MAPPKNFRTRPFAHQQCLGHLWICLIVAFFPTPARSRGFLLTRSDTQNKIFYSLLPSFDESITHSQLDSTQLDQDPGSEPLPLVADLDRPRSMALWSDTVNHWLYVWDATTQDLYKYELLANGDELTAARGLQPVAQGLDVGGIAVDNAQNVYYSNENGGSITKLPYTDRKKPEQLYSNNFNVNAPRVLTTDALYVYWGNHATGKASGSAVKAPAKVLSLTQTSYPRQLSKNVVVTNGVCVTPDFVFYTGGTDVFAVPKDALNPNDQWRLINNGFMNAAGCAADPARGAIYVADEQRGAVFELAVNFAQLREIRAQTKITTVDGAKQLAVLRSGAFSNLRSSGVVLQTSFLICASGLSVVWILFATT
ncbi:unnamed protein product [Amoebophrya sp. A120]|nr:unnamed protein product [Amoebophrya sp. A120]|eukprot:GSA120T00015683001.1